MKKSSSMKTRMTCGSSQSQRGGPRFGLQKTFLAPSGNVQVQLAAEASGGAPDPAAQGHRPGPADPVGLVAGGPLVLAGADPAGRGHRPGPADPAGLVAGDPLVLAGLVAGGPAHVPTPRQPRTTMSSIQG